MLWERMITTTAGDSNFGGELGTGLGAPTSESVPRAVLGGENSSGEWGRGSFGVEFLIELTAIPMGAVTIPFTVGGVATEGEDYSLNGAEFVVPGGNLSITHPLQVIDDYLVEGNETFDISLGTPSNGAITTPSVMTVTIVDNDTLIEMFVADAISVTEGETAEFVVSLAQTSTRKSVLRLEHCGRNGPNSCGCRLCHGSQ